MDVLSLPSSPPPPHPSPQHKKRKKYELKILHTACIRENKQVIQNSTMWGGVDENTLPNDNDIIC